MSGRTAWRAKQKQYSKRCNCGPVSLTGPGGVVFSMLRTGWLILFMILFSQACLSDGWVFRHRNLTPAQLQEAESRERVGLLAGDAQGTEEYLSPDQRAALIIRGKHQRLIVQSRFPGPLDQFCWVIPVPGRPKVEPIESMFFTRLVGLTETLAYPVPSLVRSDSAGFVDAPQDRGVNVLERKVIGVYDATILEASRADSLINWLNENGYQFSRQAQPALDRYVQKKWFYVALRIDPTKRTPRVAEDLKSGKLMPVSLSYLSETYRYPMLLTATNPGETRVALYVIGRATAAIEGFKYHYAGPVGPVDKEWGKLLPSLVEPGDRLTALYGTVRHQGLKDDLQVVPVELETAPPPERRKAPEGNVPVIRSVFAALLVASMVGALASGKRRGWFLIMLPIALVGLIYGPDYARNQLMSGYSRCKSTRQDISAAMEMYASDSGGRYPSRLEMLVPRYLKAVPTCPEGTEKYLLRVVQEPYYSRFIVYCMSDHSFTCLPPGQADSQLAYTQFLKEWHQRVHHGESCNPGIAVSHW